MYIHEITTTVMIMSVSATPHTVFSFCSVILSSPSQTPRRPLIRFLSLQDEFVFSLRKISLGIYWPLASVPRAEEQFYSSKKCSFYNMIKNMLYSVRESLEGYSPSIHSSKSALRTLQGPAGWYTFQGCLGERQQGEGQVFSMYHVVCVSVS